MIEHTPDYIMKYLTSSTQGVAETKSLEKFKIAIDNFSNKPIEFPKRTKILYASSAPETILVSPKAIERERKLLNDHSVHTDEAKTSIDEHGNKSGDSLLSFKITLSSHGNIPSISAINKNMDIYYHEMVQAWIDKEPPEDWRDQVNSDK